MNTTDLIERINELVTDLESHETSEYEDILSKMYELRNMAEVIMEGGFEYDESMDGDTATALASAGFGMDEDYGSPEDMI